MLHSRRIHIENMREAMRFDCRYHFLVTDTREKLQRSKYDIRCLGDKDVSTLITDGEHQPLNRLQTGTYRYLYGRNVKEGFVVCDPISDIPFISEEEYSKSVRIQAQEDDVLLAIKGTVGKSAVYRSSYIGKAALPREIAKIVTIRDRLLPEYVCIFLLSKYGRIQTLHSGSGNIHPLLTLDRLRKVNIVVLGPNDQKRVAMLYNKAIECEAHALEAIDSAIARIERHIDSKLGETPTWARSYRITLSQLNSVWTPDFYQPQFAETLSLIENQFRCHYLHDIADISKGDEVGSSNYNSFFEKSSKDVPFIRTSDIANYEIDNYPDYYIGQDILEELNQDLTEKDILFTNDGKIGLSAMITKFDEVIIQSHIRRIRSLGNMSQWFIFAFLNTKYAKFYFRKNTVIQTTIPTIGTKLRELPIPEVDDAIVAQVNKSVKTAIDLKYSKKILLSDAKDLVGRLIEG